MQLTSIDRWLRENFIYRTHIYAMRLPESGVPSGVLIEELEEKPSRRYKYRLVVQGKQDVESVLGALRAGNQMFATRVVETNPWYKSIIAPKGKSAVFRVFWWGVGAAMVIAVLSIGGMVMANEELRGQLMESLNLFLHG